MQRRSFFGRLVGAAAVTAVAVEAKPAPISKGTVGVTVYSSYSCNHCNAAMFSFSNRTMRCSNPDCPNYEIPIRIPVVPAERAVSDEHEAIRHALVILKEIEQDDAISAEDLAIGTAVIAQMVKRMNDLREGQSWEFGARDINPGWLAEELKPYYIFGTE